MNALRIAQLLAMAMLALSAADAARRGFADLRAVDGRGHGAAFARSGNPISWDSAYRDIHAAHALDPDNPSLMEDLGHLHAEHAVRFRDDGKGIWHSRQSLGLFRAAAQRRPVSPYVWANIALVKFRLGEIDREFSAALRQAIVLGPWEPHIQLLAADIGLGAYDQLGMDERKVVTSYIASASAVNRAALETRIAQAGRQGVACRLMEIRAVLPGIPCSQPPAAS